ncbi:amino acid ABC transporter permease [Sodalis sp. RH21]|uniref:amino acid ABC transporter permease n=1 Tax=unclassified Sodalis (in: enterobacteria) TaxID=2636512 RepID=UPI0039B5258A
MHSGAYVWDFNVVWEYRDLLRHAVYLTLSLSGLTVVLGIALGILFALLRTSGSLWLSVPVTVLVEVTRSIPSLVLLVWMYYCLPLLFGLSPSAFMTSVLALAWYSSAFFAEIFRGGIQSIDRGYIEAGYSVGMTRTQVLKRIIGPLAFRQIFPPLIGQCVLVIKNTALVGYIAVADILYVGQQISINTFRPIEVLTVVAGLFVMIILPLTLTARFLEIRFRRALQE